MSCFFGAGEEVEFIIFKRENVNENLKYFKSMLGENKRPNV